MCIKVLGYMSAMETLRLKTCYRLARFPQNTFFRIFFLHSKHSNIIRGFRYKNEKHLGLCKKII